MVDHTMKHITQNIFTLIFHPAHANQSSFYKGGSLNHFTEIVNFAIDRNIDILTMNQLFEYANQIDNT